MTTSQSPTADLHAPPFDFLGFGANCYFFRSHRTGDVVALHPRALESMGNLLALAPLNFWEEQFPDRKGAALIPAINWLIEKSILVGRYKQPGEAAS